MPADDSFGLHDDQDVGPTGPMVSQRGPEESVEKAQGRPGAFPPQDCELLPKREDFESRVAAVAQEYAGCRQIGEDDFDHETPLVTSRNDPRTASGSEVATC